MSSFGTINWQDLLKGLIVAVGSAVFAVIYTTIQAGSLTFDWKAIGITALSAALAYLSKNLFTNSTNELGKKDTK